MVSHDNPFAPPAEQDTNDDAQSIVRVDGSLLLCGSVADLTHVCWITGARTSDKERRSTRKLLLHNWPAAVRGFLWAPYAVLYVIVVLLPEELALSAFLLLVFSAVLLLDAVVSRVVPTVRLDVAYSNEGRAQRTRRYLRDLLRNTPAIIVALLMFNFVDRQQIGIPENQRILLMPIIIIVMVRFQNRLFPPKSPRRRPTVKEFSGGVFVIEHAAPEFLEGLQRWLSEKE